MQIGMQNVFLAPKDDNDRYMEKHATRLRSAAEGMGFAAKHQRTPHCGPFRTALAVSAAVAMSLLGGAVAMAQGTSPTQCHLTHKSATWAKICVTRAKWRRDASNANSMCLHRSSASSAPSLILSSPTLPTLRHDLIDRRGEVVERASDSVQLLISLASCVLITTFLQLRQPFCGPLG